MSNGKAACQAGHAFTDTLIAGLLSNDAAAFAYARLSPGTKILLTAPVSLFDDIQAVALAHDIPTFRVVDSGHVELPDFDGSPKVTALGVGPFGASRPVPTALKRLLKRADKFTGASFSHMQGQTA